MRRVLSIWIVGVCLAVAVPVAVAQAPYSPPRTPWGDPDLQAIWSGDSAFGIPLQRPAALGTKADLTDAEFADKLTRDERTRRTAENAVGSFRNDNSWLTRSFRQTSLIVDPPDGRAPALVAGAEARRTPQGAYGNGPLDGRPHVGAGVRGYLGDSRGRWEGNTLVIETTNFNGKATVPGNPVLASTELKIVERLTRVEADLLRYEATVIDPKTYTKPFTISIPFTSPPGYQVLPYECHEGNLAVLQGLGGERAEDRALEDDRKKGIIRPRRPIQGGLTVGGQPIPESGPSGQP